MQCKLENITVHYELFGEGRPIIMLHGWSRDHRYMVRDMEPLFRHRHGWKRVYPDLPGHGRTPGKDWIANQDKILDVVLDFIDVVIPGQRFAVAGTSAGAYVARGLVYRRAALIDGLLLMPTCRGVARPSPTPTPSRRRTGAHQHYLADRRRIWL